jgi:hypothetical protein
MIRSLLITAVVVAFTTPTAAHVTLETQEARVGEPYKAVLRVPHGCEGAATTALRVRIPDGVIAVKPMPKPGWTLATTNGKYSKTYRFFTMPSSRKASPRSAGPAASCQTRGTTSSCSRASLPATSKPAQNSTSRWSKNARRG